MPDAEGNDPLAAGPTQESPPGQEASQKDETSEPPALSQSVVAPLSDLVPSSVAPEPRTAAPPVEQTAARVLMRLARESAPMAFFAGLHWLLLGFFHLIGEESAWWGQVLLKGTEVFAVFGFLWIGTLEIWGDCQEALHHYRQRRREWNRAEERE